MTFARGYAFLTATLIPLKAICPETGHLASELIKKLTDFQEV